MSTTSAADGPTGSAVPLLSDQLSWQQVTDLDRDEAVARVVYEYRRHRVATLTFGWAWLAAAATAVVAFAVTLSVFALVALVAAVMLPLWRDRRVTSEALDAIAATDPPVGRLRVVLVMLSRTRPTCDPAMLTRLLTHAPDELSCAALGRHLADYCPHSAVTW